jgi:HEAT repeat protein
MPPPPVDVHALTEGLRHPDPGAREASARALVALGGAATARAVAPLIAHGDSTARNAAGEVLVRLGAPAVEALAHALRDADAEVRKFALDLLALLPAAGVAGDVAACLGDPDANVRIAAVDALGALGAAPFADALLAVYRAEPLARASVVVALARSGAAEAGPLLAKALAGDDEVVRFAAAAAAADLGEEGCLLLHALLEGPPGPLRPVALDALVRWYEAHPEAVPPSGLPADLEDELLAMLDDPDAGYRRSAAVALRHLGPHLPPARFLACAGRGDALDAALFEALAARPDPFSLLAEAGRVVPDVPAAQFALALVARGLVPAGDLAHAADFLAERFPALDADAKVAVLTLCGRLDFPELMGVLGLGLDDPDPAVAEAAADAFGLADPALR